MSSFRLTARVLHFCALFASLSAPLGAQTIDDGVMLAGRTLFAGDLYSRETWNEYWEGALKRSNANVGTVTTQANIWYANYGVTDRLNILGSVPFVSTHASQGVLHGIDGFQDLTLAAKYSVLERRWPGGTVLRTIALMSAGIPMTNYNRELLPLSIGLGSTRVAWRGTFHLQSGTGWFVTDSTGYTWRSEVQLDRPYFFTDDEFVMSDRADMPNVLDYVLSGGYMKGRVMTAVSLSQQHTLGGGDIRRQDMPFVSNRMNFTKLGASAMHPVPKLGDLAVQFSYAYTVDGRNVGQAHSFTAGLFYFFGSSSR